MLERGQASADSSLTKSCWTDDRSSPPSLCSMNEAEIKPLNVQISMLFSRNGGLDAASYRLFPLSVVFSR